MGRQKMIAIWVTTSYEAVDDAELIRQYPVDLNTSGKLLTDSWKYQFIFEEAQRRGVKPDYSKLSEVNFHLYHVRKSRLVIEGNTIEAQGIKERDVFVLLDEEEENLANATSFIQAQDFPSKVPSEITGERVTILEIKKIIEMRPLTILFLSADPTDASRLRLGQELREIQEKLQLAKLRDRFKLEQRMSARPDDITQALLDLEPQIVHFSGHGTTTGALCFENNVGGTHPIEPRAIAAVFEQFADQVSCVILNACYSEIQANAISEHIDHVIGMNQAIADEAAIAFAIGFYQGLGGGRTIRSAYKLGCAQINLHNIPEHLTPVLIEKGQIKA